MFILSFWNKAIAVNSWTTIFIMDIDDKCHMCTQRIPKTIAYLSRIVELLIELGTTMWGL